MIGFFILSVSIFGGLFWLLGNAFIIFIKVRKILQLRAKRKIVELEIKEKEIRIKYFQETKSIKEACIPKEGLKTYFGQSGHIAYRVFPSLRFFHPNKGDFFLEAVLGLWRKDTVKEIKETLKQNYNYEFWH
ncbi:MAG: hypothetical protein AAFR87_07835 [Bacteroidota bacterium]